MSNFLAAAKEFLHDRHNQKKILQISVFLTAVILGSVYYFVRPGNDMMDAAKYFSAAYGRLETVSTASYLSKDTDPSVSNEYSKLFNSEVPLSFYKKAFEQYAFMIVETYVKDDAGYVEVQMTLPNFKLSLDEIFPDGTESYLGESPTLDTLCSPEAKPFFDKLCSAIDDGTLSFTNIVVKFDTKKENDAWGLIMTEENLDAMTGYLLSSLGITSEP